MHLCSGLVTSPSDTVMALRGASGYTVCMNADLCKGLNVVDSVILINQGSGLINNSKLLQIHKSFSHCLLAVSSPQMFIE